MSLRLRTRRWLPSRSLARRSRGPLLGGLRLHVQTRWQAGDLDRQLAAGTDPMQSDALSLRVGQLGSATTRARLATALRGAVEMANGRHPPLVTTRLRLPEIEENEELILALAERLGGDEPLGVQGLAMTARLVDDRSSPLHKNGPSGLVSAAVSGALAALDRGQLTVGGHRR
jgi:hypothetical protein